MDSLHIWHKWSLAWEGVSHAGLGSIHFFQFNSIPIQVGFRIFQFNSIPIQIRFRIFQFNSNSIHFLSISIQFNSNFMHHDIQMNKITGWNKFYWIVPLGPIDFKSAWFRYWANGLVLKGQQAITWNNADSLTHTCGTRGRWVDVHIFRIIIISDAGAQIKICWNVFDGILRNYFYESGLRQAQWGSTYSSMTS